MKYQKTVLAAALLAMATTTQAGGLLTSTNQRIAFNRNFARVGAIGIDGVYFNPAGVAFIDQGFHLSLNFQNVYQTREITSTFSVPALANTPYEYPFKLNGGNTTDGSKFYQGKASVPILHLFRWHIIKTNGVSKVGLGLLVGAGRLLSMTVYQALSAQYHSSQHSSISSCLPSRHFSDRMRHLLPLTAFKAI